MMNDRELLEMAAKAAGLKIVGEVDRMICQPDHRTGGFVFRNNRGGDSCWNPLTDDGDALRLAVKLRLDIRVEDYGASSRAAGKTWSGCESHLHNGIESATRRAIVRAAAEIGKSMP